MNEQVEHVGENQVVMRIANHSDTKGTAGALTNFIKEGKQVTMAAMGAGAVNQAFKACAIARGMLAPEGKILLIIPAFADEFVGGEQKTVMRFIIRVERG